VSRVLWRLIRAETPAEDGTGATALFVVVDRVGCGNVTSISQRPNREELEP
jgi:hypothetical protein